MGDEVRILVTASRFYPNVARVEEAAADVERVFPGGRLRLAHGRCNPRHPVTREVVLWQVAEACPPARRLELLGGDWLMTQVAAQRGWETEGHAPDYHQDHAELARNRLMVNLGAELAVVLTEPCRDKDCKYRFQHITHGTAHCSGLAEAAGIKCWRYPA